MFGKQKITPFLWFDDNAEEAARFYTSIFKNSKIHQVTHYTAAGPGPEGSVMMVAFQLEGQEFTALNGGPQFKFNEAFSLVVSCSSQKEIDDYSSRLTAGGGEQRECGWVRDRFGMSWQIVPDVLPKMLEDKDAERRRRVMEAVFQMKKLDIERLEQAYEYSHR
jgi:predicted 3-demethylubiquinone-9 3-methyltransferase (glyoxalase superfamily)